MISWDVRRRRPISRQLSLRLSNRFVRQISRAGAPIITAGEDEVTWYRFAELIFQAAERRGRKSPRLVPISTAEYPTPARRPAYSVLSTEKVQRKFGIASRPLCESLDGCLDELMGPLPSPVAHALRGHMKPGTVERLLSSKDL